MHIHTIDFHPQGSNHQGIEISDLSSFYERLPNLSHDPTTPHRLHFYCLIYISKGEGNHFIDFHNHPYKEGSFIFINPNQIHAFDLHNKPQGKMVFFTPEFIDAIRIHIRVPVFTTHLAHAYTPIFTASAAFKETSTRLFSEIHKETQHEKGNELMIQLLFSALLLKLSTERPTPYYDSLSYQKIEKFTRFITLIETRYTEIRDASFYANKMGITYKTLNQICKRACNQTPKQLIDAHIILEAKRRLTVERMPIQQLAYALGFEEVSNFTKYFKKHTLTTPSEFKNNLQG